MTKWFLACSVSALTLWYFTVTPRGVSVLLVETAEKPLNIDLNGDSGYILRDKAHNLLAQLNIGDTLVPIDANLSTAQDTVGKYVYLPAIGHYIICLTDFSLDFETHVLVEVKKQSGKNKVLKAERYVHGNYPCCWNGAYDGFFRWNGLAVLKTCGTGSGFCSEKWNLFTHVIAQKEIQEIPVSGTLFYEDMYARMETTFEQSGDTLRIHYLLTEGRLREEDEQYYYNEPDQRKEQTVRCLFRNNKLVLLDPVPEAF